VSDSSDANPAGRPWRVREGALRGVRVLDLTRILSGPFCTMILADLGADVVKIEDTARGDDTRHWGPPFHGADAAYYHAVNRNKRSLAVDLKSEQGKALVRRLAGSADVLVENFRPGTAARLGLGYGELRVLNPRLVYGSVSGYGHTGPMSEQAGYDAIAQALSGAMSVTGEAGGEPVRFGTSAADLAAGMWVTIGILAALVNREQTGVGQHVDVALLDGLTAWLTYVAQNYFASGETPQRYGSAHPNIVPYQGFPTGDGDIMVAAGNDGLWRRFAEVVGLDDLVDDDRFATNPDRVRNRAELLPLLEEALAAKSAAEWTDLLTAAGVPVGPILTVPETLDHPQVLARDMVVDLPHSSEGTVRTLGSPLKLSETPPNLRHASPTHGQHTAEILADLGLSVDEISRLRDQGSIRG
jgi:crotonobetainyl-CoA:carnitine CoA-transferase CaiB-like acyl-CoA transferase